VEPGDVAGLSAALGRALVDHELRRRLAQRARAIFAERFSAAAFTGALRDLYGQLGFDG
jgi:glycosyltransferase involved in cell wall biosynthesis